ncbi:MAG: alkylmercury lyase family protein [Thioalkalispiraceae bacterium]|jgi:mercuric reductase
MEIQTAVERLKAQLPLKARQDNLPARLKAMHICVLNSLINNGYPPTIQELKKVLGQESVKEALLRLASDDLIVLDTKGHLPLGAYPVTAERTPHKITVNGFHIYAMCALDAVSVAPVFDKEVIIESICHSSQLPVNIHMQGSELLDVEPTPDVTIGIRWQMPSTVAAHSMCLEMVFFKDRLTAESWQKKDPENISLFTLPEAVAFGTAFFLPLLS